jgi:methyl-accepting chemotaxis protein
MTTPILARLGRLRPRIGGWRNLAGRMGLGFGALVVLMSVVVAVAGWQALRLERQLDAVANSLVPRLLKVQALARSVDRLAVAAHSAIDAPDDSIRAVALAGIAKGRSEVGQQIQELQDALRADPKGTQLATELGDVSSGILVSLVKLTRVAKMNNPDLMKTVAADTQSRIDTLGQAIDKAQALQMQRVAEAQQQCAQASRLAVVEVGAALAAAIALAAVLAWRLSSSVTRPVRAAVGFAERIAEGDLTGQLTIERRDELGELQKALQGMQSRLGSLVGDIQDVAQQMSEASGEVASGSTDLGRRTEAAAHSIKETAQSMDQLASRVHGSAASARDAADLVGRAEASARRGGDVVARVVDNMQDISAASRRISDITGVIDGISFQTNILALNAAVEAARAGEHGRGFAVVAGEVRSLAGRAADAAREIRTLIASSVEKIDSGCKLVESAGSAMGEIVEGVAQVKDIISGISETSSRQSGEIDSVARNLTQLEQMTQQNSALVDQSTASAEGMREQSMRLRSMVSAFSVRAAG